MSTVSIIMPVFNAELTIQRSLKSCIEQTYPDWELIVIDDASTDDSLCRVLDFDDKRILVHRLDANSGAAIARNVGLKLAQGDWITVLDADDEYHPRRLEWLLSAAAHARSIYSSRVVLFDFVSPYIQTKRGKIFFSKNQNRLVPRGCNMPYRISTLRLMRSDVAVKPFFPSVFLRDPNVRYPDLPVAHDYAFLGRLLSCDDRPAAVQVPVSGYFWRIVGTSITQGTEGRSTKMLDALRETMSAPGVSCDVRAGVEDRLRRELEPSSAEIVLAALKRRDFSAATSAWGANAGAATSELLRMMARALRFRFGLLRAMVLGLDEPLPSKKGQVLSIGERTQQTGSDEL